MPYFQFLFYMNILDPQNPRIPDDPRINALDEDPDDFPDLRTYFADLEGDSLRETDPSLPPLCE